MGAGDKHTCAPSIPGDGLCRGIRSSEGAAGPTCTFRTGVCLQSYLVITRLGIWLWQPSPEQLLRLLEPSIRGAVAAQVLELRSGISNYTALGSTLMTGSIQASKKHPA